MNSQKQNGKATIKDVAKAAGVSIATVSRVINKNYYVSPEIKQKVQKAISSSGYVPDSIARTMKNNNTNLIGFIISNISNTHMMAIGKAVENVIRESNYSLLVCSTENDDNLEIKYLNAFMSRRISGIILHSTGNNDAYIAEKVSHDIPMTLLFRHNEHPAFTGDVVDSDGAAGVYKLAEHLIAHGHSRIGLVAGPLHTSTGRDRYHGFLQALSDHEIVTDPELLYFGDFSSSSGFEGTKQLLSMHAPPTALLCLSNTIAIGSMQFLRHANIQVPKDVSFVTFGEIEHVDLMWLNPTRIPQNPTIIGKKVGQMILDRIEHPEKANREIIFASEIIEGDSVRDISQAE